MNKWILLLSLILFIGCKKEQASYFTTEKASDYFKKVETICNNDNGHLWGRNLHGPVLFADRATRRIFSNFPDEEGLLRPKDGVYTGTFPREMVINQNPVYYGGTLFALAPLPPEENEYRIISRAIHGLFHYFQETTGYTSSGFNTANMDEQNARLWIKLEWKALRKALNTEGKEQQLAIRDALIFRCSNRELFSKYAVDETRYENFEGLATFTYILLSTNSQEEYMAKLFEYLDRLYSMQSYARSYGSVHGALYATLMHRKNFDFSVIKSEDTDLCTIVKELYEIQMPEVCRDVAGSIALNYDIEQVREEEETRETAIRESSQRQISIFTERPVVFLELESPYYDFEPEDIHAMDTLGTLYNRMRISDNWGKLTVDKGGCLISNNFRFLRITAKGFKSAKNHFEGDGWNLLLNDNWEIVSVDQNYLVRKLIP